jgi:hypothetical protein
MVTVQQGTVASHVASDGKLRITKAATDLIAADKKLLDTNTVNDMLTLRA